MLSIPQIELNVTQAYIKHIRDKFPKDNRLAERYIFILEIREWQLKRRLLKLAPTLENLQTLKTGHRNAEQFYFDIRRGSPQATLQEINEILQGIAVEFHAEIVEIESQHPHLRAEFAREREEYRLMWNDYVTDALEAEQNE